MTRPQGNSDRMRRGTRRRKLRRKRLRQIGSHGWQRTGENWRRNASGNSTRPVDEEHRRRRLPRMARPRRRRPVSTSVGRSFGIEPRMLCESAGVLAIRLTQEALLWNICIPACTGNHCSNRTNIECRMILAPPSNVYYRPCPGATCNECVL